MKRDLLISSLLPFQVVKSNYLDSMQVMVVTVAVLQQLSQLLLSQLVSQTLVLQLLLLLKIMCFINYEQLQIKLLAQISQMQLLQIQQVIQNLSLVDLVWKHLPQVQTSHLVNLGVIVYLFSNLIDLELIILMSLVDQEKKLIQVAIRTFLHLVLMVLHHQTDHWVLAMLVLFIYQLPQLFTQEYQLFSQKVRFILLVIMEQLKLQMQKQQQMELMHSFWRHHLQIDQGLQLQCPMLEQDQQMAIQKEMVLLIQVN